MEEFLDYVRHLVSAGHVRISEHGYDELADDDLTAGEVVAGLQEGIVVAWYPNYPKGPCVLLKQADRAGRPIHAVWGIPRGYERPAVLVTAYRPDPTMWNDDFTARS